MLYHNFHKYRVETITPGNGSAGRDIAGDCNRQAPAMLHVSIPHELNIHRKACHTVMEYEWRR